MPTATAASSSSAGLSVAEIKGLHKELGKAITADVQKDITAILDRLKEGVVPTEEIIRSTKIGQIVGKLRTNSNAQVASQAKSLVQGWKVVVDQERAKNKSTSTSTSKSNDSNSNSASAPAASNSGSGPASNSGSTPTPAPTSPTPAAVSHAGSASPALATTAGASSSSNNNTASPAATVTTTAPPPTTSSLPPSTGKKPDFTILNDKTRNACLKVIFDALKTAGVQEVDDSQLFAISTEVESSVFARMCPASAVTAEYRNKIRSLSLNLKDAKNPSFRQRVARGIIPANTLVDLTPKEMASEERLAEYRTLEQQNMLTAQSAAEQEAETDAFQCGRCKQRKCRYYQKQTRSADEPMTTFVSCTNCGNKWKFC